MSCGIGKIRPPTYKRHVLRRATWRSEEWSRKSSQAYSCSTFFHLVIYTYIPLARRCSDTMRLLWLALLLLSPAIRAAVLAIDYGAEFTKLSLVKPGVPFDVILDRDSKRKIQSVVGWKREDRVFGAEGKMSVSRHSTPIHNLNPADGCRRRDFQTRTSPMSSLCSVRSGYNTCLSTRTRLHYQQTGPSSFLTLLRPHTSRLRPPRPRKPGHRPPCSPTSSRTTAAWPSR